MAGTVTIALAGGAGAAIGASLGQFVQWWREHVRKGIEERRRNEDRRDALDRERREHRHEAYVQMLGLLPQITSAVSECTHRAGKVERGDDMYAVFAGEWLPYMERFVDLYGELSPLGTAYGSEVVMRAIYFLDVVKPTLVGTGGDDLGPVAARLWTVEDGTARDDFVTSGGQRRSLSKAIHESVNLVGETCWWLIDQMRYEMGTTDTKPEPLAHNFSLETLA